MEWIVEVAIDKNNGNGYSALYTVDGENEAMARAQAIDIAFAVKDVCKAVVRSIKAK